MDNTHFHVTQNVTDVLAVLTSSVLVLKNYLNMSIICVHTRHWVLKLNFRNQYKSPVQIGHHAVQVKPNGYGCRISVSRVTSVSSYFWFCVPYFATWNKKARAEMLCSIRFEIVGRHLFYVIASIWQWSYVPYIYGKSGFETVESR